MSAFGCGCHQYLISNHTLKMSAQIPDVYLRQSWARAGIVGICPFSSYTICQIKPITATLASSNLWKWFHMFTKGHWFQISVQSWPSKAKNVKRSKLELCEIKRNQIPWALLISQVQIWALWPVWPLKVLDQKVRKEKRPYMRVQKYLSFQVAPPQVY